MLKTKNTKPYILAKEFVFHVGVALPYWYPKH